MDIVIGYRPVTSDVVPIIGNLSENVWCLYGTIRDGFTWAPFFAKYLTFALVGKNNTIWNQLLNICSPSRSFISSGAVDECIRSYVFNKRYENFDHRRKFTSEELKAFQLMAEKAHKKINSGQSNKVGINPEMINILYYTL